ncbi:MAG: transposase [Bacilli bacterium]|nr:transposase [Bacilli bacterium]
MTQYNYIKDILNIKDVNVYFNENCLEISEYKGVNTKIFHGYLSYIPTHCDRCGHVNNGHEDIIAWGWKKNCKVKVTKVCGYNAILLLDKKRFKCNHCGKTFTARTNFVDFHKQISNDTKLNITLDLIHKGTEKDIARNNNVSTNTVNRILHNISEDKLVKRQGHLPKIIGIDEFKGPKDTISKMAFIIVDEENKNIFDLLNSRKTKDIKNYFKRYSKRQRDKVKFITMDLYKPYYKLMKNLFRNAIIVPDRFHIVLQIRNALDSTRIINLTLTILN